MKFPIHFIPYGTRIDFLSKKWFVIATSMVMILATLVLLATRGLNLGIDFTGGILIEAQFQQAPDIGDMRTLLSQKIDSDISLQRFGTDNNILIRVGQKNDSKTERDQIVATIKDNLKTKFGNTITYQKVDYVGPKVGGELLRGGSIALALSFLAIMIYVWSRFEWQFGLGAIAALVHDSVLTLGFFSVTQLEFNLSSVAAVLTIIGYSINDSVVVFDRIRENMRRYKTMPMDELINISINDTLSRTTLTAGTTLMSLLALVLLGGPVIKSFSLSTLFGISIGTYSSIYISAPILIFMGIREKLGAGGVA